MRTSEKFYIAQNDYIKDSRKNFPDYMKVRLWRKPFTSRLRYKSRLLKVTNWTKYVNTLISFPICFSPNPWVPSCLRRTKHSCYQLLGRLARNLILSLSFLMPFLNPEYCWMNSRESQGSSRFEGLQQDKEGIFLFIWWWASQNIS